MKQIKLVFTALLALSWSVFVLADSVQDQAPIAMLKDASAQMMSALKNNKASLKNNPSLMYQTVKRILLPHIDLESMSRSVVGRTYWMQATPEQKNQFKDLFTRQVVQTYSTALSSYTDERIDFYPIRGGITGPRVQVDSVIIRDNGQNIPVSYRLIKQGNQWKVYDFSVEGISLVQSYNSQFAGDLQQSGVAGLITKMQQRYGK